MDTAKAIEISESAGKPSFKMPVGFEDWICNRSVVYLGTNAGAEEIPFQGWRHFKEAFAPELIAKAVGESEIPVARCMDPFGGSGTTALACQYLGVSPITIEVNPFLADLIQAKLEGYDIASLRRAYRWIMSEADRADIECAVRRLKANAPATFAEPGVKERFVFFDDVLRRIIAYREVIKRLRTPSARRLFKVLLGSVTVPVSNVTISGKGRRYRGNWLNRRSTAADVNEVFCERVKAALTDIERYGVRANSTYSVLRGDARRLLAEAGPFDLVVSSPPYPNSADYTDVYNVELWTLGYIGDWNANIELRQATLTSHVQLKRRYAPPPTDSRLLLEVLAALRRRRSLLWHNDIPEMIGAYFADLVSVLHALKGKLTRGGRVYLVLGDSRYVKVTIPTATILSSLACALGFKLISAEPFRSMRVAPQQGGRPGLSETLLVLRRD